MEFNVNTKMISFYKHLVKVNVHSRYIFIYYNKFILFSYMCVSLSPTRLLSDGWETDILMFICL